jgi:hypothetical protein
MQIDIDIDIDMQIFHLCTDSVNPSKQALFRSRDLRGAS